MLDRVGGGIDEGHRIRSDRDDGKRLVVGREAHAVDKHLSLVERAEIAGLGIAEADDAEQLVVDGIGDGDGVGKLFRRVDAVAMADRNVRGGRGAGCLAGQGAAGDIGAAGQQMAATSEVASRAGEQAPLKVE